MKFNQLNSLSLLITSALLVAIAGLAIQVQNQKRIQRGLDERLDRQIKFLQTAIAGLRKEVHTVSVELELLDHPGSVPKHSNEVLQDALDKLGSSNLIESYKAGRILKKMGNKATPALLKLVQEGNSHAKKAALFILRDLEDPENLAHLRNFAIQSPDHAVRAGALVILAKHKDPLSNQTFKKALKDPKSEVHHAAVAGIRRTKNYEAVASLLEVYCPENSHLSREVERTIHSLNKDNPRRFHEEIIKLSPELRFRLVKILGKDNSENPFEILSQLLDDQDPRVALSTARVLSKRGKLTDSKKIKKYLDTVYPEDIRSIAQEIINKSSGY